MAFHPKGTALATATGSAKNVYHWDPTTGKRIRKLDASEKVYAVAFAPGAPLFAAGCEDGVRVWRTDTWEFVVHHPVDLALRLAFGPGSTPLLAASCDGVVVLHDVTKSAPSRRDYPPHMRLSNVTYDSHRLVFSPDGKLLISNNTLTGVIFWNPVTGEKLREIKRTMVGGPLNISPDGSRIVLADGRWIEVWPVENAAKKPLLRFEALSGKAFLRQVCDAAWSSEGRALLTSSTDGLTCLWDATTGDKIRSFDWGIGTVECTAFSPDGLTCAAGGQTGQVVVWDVDS
jgi:WD40 repeat protein